MFDLVVRVPPVTLETLSRALPAEPSAPVAERVERARRVARTLADLDGEAAIEGRHVAEAMRYRVPDLHPAPV